MKFKCEVDLAQNDNKRSFVAPFVQYSSKLKFNTDEFERNLSFPALTLFFQTVECCWIPSFETLTCLMAAPRVLLLERRRNRVCSLSFETRLLQRVAVGSCTSQIQFSETRILVLKNFTGL